MDINASIMIVVSLRSLPLNFFFDYWELFLNLVREHSILYVLSILLQVTHMSHIYVLKKTLTTMEMILGHLQE